MYKAISITKKGDTTHNWIAYSNNNVYHDFKLDLYRREPTAYFRITPNDLIRSIGVNPMPDVGIKLYVDSNSTRYSVNDAHQGNLNLAGLVPYNPSSKLHIGKTIFFFNNFGLPIDSGSTVPCLLKMKDSAPLLSQPLTQSLDSSTLKPNISVEANDKNSVLNVNNATNHIYNLTNSEYFFDWDQLNINQKIAKLMNPVRYIEANKGLQYKAERISEMQIGNKTIEYSDFIWAPYNNKNVFHEKPIELLTREKYKRNSYNLVSHLDANPLPIVGTELYVKSSTPGVKSSDRGNLAGFVKYNPSYKPHVGKKIFYIYSQGLPIDSGSIVPCILKIKSGAAFFFESTLNSTNKQDQHSVILDCLNKQGKDFIAAQEKYYSELKEKQIKQVQTNKQNVNITDLKSTKKRKWDAIN